jgi:hypothetical protein
VRTPEENAEIQSVLVAIRERSARKDALTDAFENVLRLYTTARDAASTDDDEALAADLRALYKRAQARRGAT